MNILFLYDHPLKPENGGTSRATFLVMEELKRRGYHCWGHLHFSQENPNKIFYNGECVSSLYNFLVDKNIDIVVNQIAYHHWLLQEFLNHGGQQWIDEGGKVISFMHFDPTPAPFYITPLIKGLKDKNFVGKIKRLLLLCYLPIFLFKVEKNNQASLRYVYEHSHRYVVMSNAYIKVFAKRAKIVDISKMRVITNMLTFPNILTPDALNIKEKIVIVVARLCEEQKKISFILKVWKSIKNYNGYKLQIIGDGPDRNMYINWAKKNNMSNVEFLGQQSPLSFYLKARIFLMSSPREGWGLTITESMQNGVVPIVLNTSKVFKDIIQDNIDGFLPKSKEDYIEKLQLLLINDSIRNKMAIAGLHSVSRFTPSVIGEKWNDMIIRLKYDTNC